MTDIRCSNCGQNNPDSFDVCQFCQAPLKADSMIHIGEEPVKRNTDELEEILPDWLKDARQKGKSEEADEALRSQARSRSPKEEPPDLLAGLMSQAASEEEEVPDWLTGIDPVADQKPSPQPPSAAKGEPSDFFAQFEQPTAQPSMPPPSEPVQEDLSAWLGMDEKPSAQKDDPTGWFSQEASMPSAQPFAFEDAGGTPSAGDNWMKDLGLAETAEPEPSPSKEPEDLSWLRDLEAASKGPGESPAPQQTGGFDFAPASSSDEDLSWLNTLGGTPAPAFGEPAPSQSSSPEDDLSWLNTLGGTSAPVSGEPAPAQATSSQEDLDWLRNFEDTSATASEEPVLSAPPSSEEDLGWLKNFGGVPPATPDEPARAPSTSDDRNLLNTLDGTSVPAFDEPVTAQQSSSQEDLDWLKNLGGTPAPAFEEPVTAQPPSQFASTQDDLSWLNDLGGSSTPSDAPARAFADTGELYGGQAISDTSKPFQTAPLKELLDGEPAQDATPDWLKSAMEEPSMPAPGALSMDWFSGQEKQKEGDLVPSQGEPASARPAFDFPSGSDQDMDELFKEMPDWLSSEAESAQPSQPETAAATPAFTQEGALAPVELPSWVQAMRPVDSAIGGTPASVDMVTEREGPLAGFRGVIPFAPIGSSLRPKAFSLKLQVTDEQETAASLLEQIINNETLGQMRKTTAKASSPRILRWVLSGLFLLILGVVLGLGLQTMPIYAPPSVNELSSLVAGIPENTPVLVVVDYEPSFSGELEAAAGPLLDQLALSRHSTFTFVSMSPNGAALVERLMFNTNVSKPVPDGLGYQLETHYFNTGFLPGGSSGVLGFIGNPADDFARFEAVILLTDNAETGRVWVEQLEVAGQKRPELAAKPLLLVSSAQAGPMLQPYVDSGQVDVMINGLYDAAKYELVNVSRPGLARSYWDAFGYGLMLAVAAIVLGSVWSIFMGIRERRAEAEQG